MEKYSLKYTKSIVEVYHIYPFLLFFGTTRLRDYEATRNFGTTRLQDYKTTRLRDNETARPRDHETAGQQKNTGVLRHSQAFSVVRGCARLCEAAWRQSGADVVHRKRECHGIVPKRTARGTLLFGMCRRCAAITTSA